MDVQLTRDGADGPFFRVVEAQDLRLDVRRCHHGRVPSDRVAQRPDDEPGDAEIPGGPEPNIAVRTSDSARPTATAGQSRLLRRSRSSASWTPADHRSAGRVNRDASLSCRAPGNDARAQHGRAVPDGWFGSAVRRPAGCGGAHAGRSGRRSRSGRGRSSCRSAPGGDIPHKRTAGLTRHRRRRIGRHHVDERHDCRDNRPACVSGTVWGHGVERNRQV